MNASVTGPRMGVRECMFVSPSPPPPHVYDEILISTGTALGGTAFGY